MFADTKIAGERTAMYGSCMPGPESIIASTARPFDTRRRHVIAAATIGNLLEWYDNFAYGVLALVMAKLFFPAGNEVTSLILAFVTYGAGLAMRPVGAIVLGAQPEVAARGRSHEVAATRSQPRGRRHEVAATRSQPRGRRHEVAATRSPPRGRRPRRPWPKNTRPLARHLRLALRNKQPTAKRARPGSAAHSQGAPR